MKIYFIYVTFGTLSEAKRLGGKLVKNKLAACTNIIPTIYSTYVWKNKTMMDKECSMIVKTSNSKVKINTPMIVLADGTSLIPKIGNQTQNHNP